MMSELKQVKVQLHTTIYNGDEKDTFELLTNGTLQKKGVTWYLRYDEVQADMENVHTIVKWAPEEVYIMRSGKVKMRQRFIKDLMTVGNYESQYGIMQMLTTTQSMKHSYNEQDQSGQMILKYDLNMNGADVGQYEMKITYKEETSK